MGCPQDKTPLLHDALLHDDLLRDDLLRDLAQNTTLASPTAFMQNDGRQA